MITLHVLDIYHEAQRESLGVICRVEEHGEEYGKEDQGTPFRSRYSIQTMEESIQAIFSYNYVAMRV